MCMVQVSLLLIYLLSYTFNPLLAVARVVFSILSSVTHYFLQFNSLLIIIDPVLVLVLGLEGLVLVLVSIS